MESLETLTEAARGDARVLAVLLFGSRARGEALASSDTDVCLVLAAGSSPEVAGNVQIEYGGSMGLDVKVFQKLPLYVRQRVLKDGKVLLVKDEDALYETAFRTIREFEDFRPYYRAYLESVADGRS